MTETAARWSEISLQIPRVEAMARASDLSTDEKIGVLKVVKLLEVRCRELHTRFKEEQKAQGAES